MKSITKTEYHTGLYYTEPLYYMLLIAAGLYDVGFKRLFIKSDSETWDISKIHAINKLKYHGFEDSLFSPVLISPEGELFLETIMTAWFDLASLYDKVKSIATLYKTHSDTPKWRHYVSRISIYIDVKEASQQLAKYLRTGKITEGSPLFSGKPITDPFTQIALGNSIDDVLDACFKNPAAIDYVSLDKSLKQFFQLLKDNNK